MYLEGPRFWSSKPFENDESGRLFIDGKYGRSDNSEGIVGVSDARGEFL
jgi:hypothetical protein